MEQLEPGSRPARGGWAIPLASTGALLAGCLLLYRDYGITWDEDIQQRYAEFLVRFYETLGQDQSAFAIRNLRHYGGLFELVAGLMARLTPGAVFDTRHLVNACVGSLAVLAASRSAWRIGGPLAAGLAAVFLAGTPLYVGHLFNNPKDLPFAAAMAVVQCVFLGAWDELPRPRPRRVLALGLAAGAVLGTRPEALPVLSVVWSLFAAAWFLARGRRGVPRTTLSGLAATSLGIGAVAWCVMLAVWPYALRAPLRTPFEAFSLATHLNRRGQVLFAGSYVTSGRLPWDYVPVWSASVLPEFLALALLAGIAALWLGVRSGKPIASERFWQTAFLAGCALVPVAAAIVLRPSLYDGVRHFLFVLPALAALAGIGLAEFLRSAAALGVRAATAALVAALVALTAYDMARIHPYQSAYFNRSIGGGLAGAAGRFETDYWLSSYKEAAEWLLRHYGHGLPRKVRVGGLYESTPATYYLLKTAEGQRRFHAVSLDDAPHVVVATPRWGTWRGIEGRVLHVVQRQGVPLAYVIETRKPLPFFARNPREGDPRLALP